MARFDVHPIPGKKRDGYVLDVQADLLAALTTRTVLPLLPESTAPKPISDLNPIFDIEGTRHVMVTQAMASIPAKELKPAVTSLAAHRDTITRALDTLLTGF